MHRQTDSFELTLELRDANRIRPSKTLESERVRVSALVGVWLLLPLALVALAFMLNGVFILALARFSDDPTVIEMNFADFNISWFAIAMTLQVLYWCLLSRPWYLGFWAVIPVLGLIPTFFLARQCLQRSPLTEITSSE